MVASNFQKFLLRKAFKLLYHSFAWSYDLVASIASANKWLVWLRSIVPYLSGPKILELGTGPGHLLTELTKRNFTCFGIDESRQMAALTRQKLLTTTRKASQRIYLRLARARAQFLPFASSTFDNVVSTFPTEFIFDRLTLDEIARVLNPDGQAYIILGAEVTGKRWNERLAEWLSKTTHQSADWNQDFGMVFDNSGLDIEVFTLNIGASRVMMVKASKRMPSVTMEKR